MRALVIAVFAAIVTSSGCVQPTPQAPASREPEPADVEEPASAVTTTSPVAAPSDELPPARLEPPAIATTPAAPVAVPVSEAPPPSPPQEAPSEDTVDALASAPAAAPSFVDAIAPSPEELPPPAVAPVAVPTPVESPASSALDLAGLEQRLRETQAIGVFTKLSLKNQVDDLLGQFRAFYRGQLEVELTELRQRYELLLFKVLTLLQDADRELAEVIAASREAIWGILSDPEKLAQI
jgi:hypothetical protein